MKLIFQIMCENVCMNDSRHFKISFEKPVICIREIRHSCSDRVKSRAFSSPRRVMDAPLSSPVYGARVKLDVVPLQSTLVLSAEIAAEAATQRRGGETEEGKDERSFGGSNTSSVYACVRCRVTVHVDACDSARYKCDKRKKKEEKKKKKKTHEKKKNNERWSNKQTKCYEGREEPERRRRGAARKEREKR